MNFTPGPPSDPIALSRTSSSQAFPSRLSNLQFSALVLNPTPAPIPCTYNPNPASTSPNTHVNNDSTLRTASEVPEAVNIEVEVEVRTVPGEVLVVVGGLYGTVEEPATRYVALVVTGVCDSAEATDEARLELSNWKLDWAALELAAWTEVEMVVVVAEEASEKLCSVFTTLIDTYNSTYQ
jgi:hypothetical protein